MVLYSQLHQGGIFQMRTRLCNQYAIGLGRTFYQGVGMSTDDGIEPRIGLGQLHVVFNAAMRKQNHHIVLVSKEFVIGQHHFRTLEAHLFQFVRMRPRNAVMSDFNHTHHSHLHALVLHGHKRLDIEIDRHRNGDIGTEKGEISPFNVILKVNNITVPLMVAYRAEVESCSVHQLYHGVIDRIVLVVDRITRAVVTR